MGNWKTFYEGLASLPPGARESWLTFDHYYSDQAFPAALPLVFADKPRRLLDVGGNTGKFAIQCAKHDPDVQVTIADLPQQLKLARENIRPRYQYDLGKIRCGELETDASYVFARESGGRLAYSAATFTKLFYRGQTVIEAQPTTFPLQLDGAPPRVSLPKWRFWEDEVAVKN